MTVPRPAHRRRSGRPVQRALHTRKAPAVLPRRPRVDSAHPHAGTQQSTGLGAVNGFQQMRVSDVCRPLRYHAPARRSSRRQCPRLVASSSTRRTFVSADVPLSGESTSKASVSSASPARIAMASPNTLWQVGTPAPQVVVVQRGKIVVNQRIGVNQFQRRRPRLQRLRDHPRQRAQPR